jgi:hypothetical protein
MPDLCKRAMTTECTVLLHNNTLALITILCEHFIPVSNEAVNNFVVNTYTTCFNVQ